MKALFLLAICVIAIIGVTSVEGYHPVALSRKMKRSRHFIPRTTGYNSFMPEEFLQEKRASLRSRYGISRGQSNKPGAPWFQFFQ